MSRLVFEPITLRGMTARNRLWVPPMCQYSVEAQDGVATDWHMVHLGGLARGGAGAVIVEATAVTPEGRISPQDLGLWNDEQRDALAPIVGFMQSQGTKAGIQLAHAGRKASTYRTFEPERSGSVPVSDGGWQTVAPSALAYPELAEPQALDQAGIKQLIAAFQAAARRAVDAGFDFIEVHGAHGYLLHEFLSPLSNTRDDDYGGSLENRARFLLQVVDVIREEVPDDMPLFVRLSAVDWIDTGLTIDDTVQVVRWLDEHGVDLIDVSSGSNLPAKIPSGPGYQVKFAETIRERTGVPTAAVGLITQPFQAEHILTTGQADVVLVGRESLRNANFPIHAAQVLRHKTPPTPIQYHRAYR
ncbi:NADH:flavin oxidoreductase/NADH oxidase [Enteractinococcus coprophilus]|uniref:2,4-dienoyl-CoA reductase-like NADH-dependent reductase (Old Yellow Enzyme family) n=1 Tax=Enteractinococcus coprophilus TaxID=1027633 RepID=A0A543AIY7_9MICC|nr:NADH:flavin oxidoreductase/NADH oxidase [Enteractinococcus coprophilus]TQL72548.1 2,4-dienoyl-CoA reductase-like NADH-dependent reductase (Old Yellow Enzyme family) [Enteractinococcus coprophilus]